MRALSILVIGALALAACGERAEAPAPEAAAPETSSATSSAAAVLAQPAEALSVEDSCREAVRRLYGQEGDAVAFDEADFSVSWPAPVDGGRLTFACSFVGSQVSLSRGDQRQTVDISSPADAPAQQEAR